MRQFRSSYSVVEEHTLPPTCCEFIPDPEFRNSASIQIDVKWVPSNESIRNERRRMQKGSEDSNM
jgi:hypothetical protein